MKSSFSYKWLLSPQVILVSLLAGMALGYFKPSWALHFEIIGEMFLDSLTMCIIPLLISASIKSVSSIMRGPSNIKTLLGIFLLIMFGTAFLGALLGILGTLGKNTTPDFLNSLGKLILSQQKIDTHTGSALAVFLKDLIPRNILQAIVTNANLSILCVSILLGLASGILPEEKTNIFLSFTNNVFEIFMTLINRIIYLLPIGLFALVSTQVAHMGIEVVFVMSKMILLFLCACIFILFASIFAIASVEKTKFLEVLKLYQQALVIGFVSSSRYAALPSVLEANSKLSAKRTDEFENYFLMTLVLNPAGSAFFFSMFSVFMLGVYNHPINLEVMIVIVAGSSFCVIAMGGIPAIAAFSFFSIVANPLNIPVEVAVILLINVAYLIDPLLTLSNLCLNISVATVLASRSRPDPNEARASVVQRDT